MNKRPEKLTFEGIRNFRDCGGYPTRDARAFRNGMLYRSAHFPLATDADLSRLQALGIGTIVDLRRVSERTLNPSRRWPDFRARVIERDGGQEAEEAPHLLVLRELGRSSESPADIMTQMYRLLPFEPMILDLMRAFLSALADADAPVVVHCTAGKDRTGLAVALAHHIAGVARDNTIIDYLESNNAGLLDAEALQRARDRFTQEGRPINDDAIRAVFAVAPGYLHAMFDAIAKECGSTDRYIDAMIGLAPSAREAIVARFTA